MENIDIIAGTMTSLIYQLIPYNKIVWVLDTECKYMEDLLEGGYAHTIKFEDIDKLEEKYFLRTEVNYHYFYSSESLRETLSKHVLSQLDRS